MRGDASGVRSRRWQRRFHVAWSVVIVGVAALVLMAFASSKAPPGQYEGIGWGCSLHGRDAAAFAAIFVVPIAAMLLVVGNVIIALVAKALRRRQTQTSAA